jgi:alpha-tubulin suppressor-like RCC1 family protein
MYAPIYFSYLSVQQELIDVAVISLGASDHCALLKNNKVQCWGSYSLPITVPNLTTKISTITGNCALLETGKVTCWKYYDQPPYQPVEVANLTDVSAIAQSSGNMCAVLKTGGVKCWGANVFGQLGDGTTTYHDTPVSVIGITNAVAVLLQEKIIPVHYCSTRVK